MYRFYIIGSLRYLLILWALYAAINFGALGLLLAAAILTLMTPPVRINDN